MIVATVLTSACTPSMDTTGIDTLPAETRSKAQNITIIRRHNPKGIPYDRLTAIEAVSCKKHQTAPPPTLGGAIERLQYKALLLGANAVAGVSCARTGIDPQRNCWQSIVCTGTALKFRAAYPGNNNTIASSSGSGFFFNRRGNVLTNAHVVRGCNRVRIRVQNKIIQAHVAVKDPNNDIAVLRTDVVPDRFLAFAGDRDPKLSEDVLVLGYPLRDILSNDMHATSGDITALSGLRGDRRFLQLSAPVQPGNSGSPVIAPTGNVIGMVVSKLNAMSVAGSTGDIPQNVNFAIKAGLITKFLASRKIKFSTGSASFSSGKSELVEKSRAAAIPILCDK